jgi:hypothetical protein
MPKAAKAGSSKGKAKGKNTAATRFLPYRRCAQRPPRFSHFLDLPAELRLMVYSHLLRIPEAADVCGIWNEKPTVDVALLRTCKQIHGEASHYFYSTNTFCFLEHCDDFQDDDDDLAMNQGRMWLTSIGKTNALSIRHLQLRIREERATKYYMDLLAYIATQSPNLMRLALIAEKHQISKSAVHHGHLLTRWEPNHVTPLGIWTMFLLKNSLRLFNLNVLLLAGRRREVLMNQLCYLYQCRVQAIDRDVAKRRDDGCRSLWKQKKWYDGVPMGKDERRVARLEGMDPENPRPLTGTEELLEDDDTDSTS